MHSPEEYTTRAFDPSRRFMDTTYAGTVGSYCGNGVVEPEFEQCEPPNTATCSATCQTISGAAAPAAPAAAPSTLEEQLWRALPPSERFPRS